VGFLSKTPLASNFYVFWLSSSCKQYALPVYGPQTLCKIQRCGHLLKIHYYCDSISYKMLKKIQRKVIYWCLQGPILTFWQIHGYFVLQSHHLHLYIHRLSQDYKVVTKMAYIVMIRICHCIYTVQKMQISLRIMQVQWNDTLITALCQLPFLNLHHSSA